MAKEQRFDLNDLTTKSMVMADAYEKIKREQANGTWVPPKHSNRSEDEILLDAIKNGSIVHMDPKTQKRYDELRKEYISARKESE